MNILKKVRPDKNTRKIFVQFVYEFAVPFFIAALWTWFDWDQSKTAFQMLSIGAVHFFAVGWFFSNWNRIKKQNRNEAGITGIGNNLEKLILNLEASTETMIGYSTGGNSFVEVIQTPITPLNRAEFALMHHGTFPLYDVTVRIVDLERLQQFGSALASHENTYHFDVLIPQHVTVISLNYQPERFSYAPRHYNIFVTARNGSTQQMLQLVLVDGILRSATSIDRGGELIFEDAAPDYPKDNNGKVDWANNLLKKKFNKETDVQQ